MTGRLILSKAEIGLDTEEPGLVLPTPTGMQPQFTDLGRGQLRKPSGDCPRLSPWEEDSTIISQTAVGRKRSREDPHASEDEPETHTATISRYGEIICPKCGEEITLDSSGDEYSDEDELSEEEPDMFESDIEDDLEE